MSEINLDESMEEILNEIESGEIDQEPAVDEAIEIEKPAKAKEPEPEPEADPVADPVDIAADPVAPEEEVEPQLKVPPTTWTAEAKSKYATLPAWAKKEVHKRERDMLNGINTLRQNSTFGERLSKAVAPYQALLNAKNAQPEQVVQSMLNTFYQLETATPQRRASLLRDLALKYETDLAALANPDSKVSEIDRYVSPLQQEIQQLKAQLQGQQQASQQATLAEAQSAIAQFESETDESGNLKRPYFHNVSDLMATLISEGRATTLEDAYEKAIWADPSTRSVLLSEQAAQAEAKRQEEARRKASAARKASSVNLDKRGQHEIKGGSKPTGSMTDTLNDIYESLTAQ